MYEIRFLEEASTNLERFDKTIIQGIWRKLKRLAENSEAIEPKNLRSNLSGFAKLREGDDRIIYQVSHEEKIVVVRFIGHRSEVYKRQ